MKMLAFKKSCYLFLKEPYLILIETVYYCGVDVVLNLIDLSY